MTSPFLLLWWSLTVYSLPYFAVTNFGVQHCHTNQIQAWEDPYAWLITERKGVFLSHRNAVKIKETRACKVLRCSRSRRLYKNTQRLGFFQTPHPCLGITLQAFPDKQLPSLRWTYSTIWQTVLRPRASFPVTNRKYLQGQSRGKRGVSQSILLQSSVTAETQENTVPMSPRDAGSGCVPQPVACWAQRNWLLPCKEPKKKDQYLPKKRRSATSRIIILSTQWSIYKEK